MTDTISLRIDGVDWTYWKSCKISTQMDAIAGSFSLTLVDRWESGAQAVPLAAGMPCQIMIGADCVVDGYIDKVSFAISAAEHGVSVSGRDKSGDLVDCSAVHRPGQWSGLTVLQLAEELARPFGVSVRAEGDVGAPLPTFKLEQGESAFEALDRALKERELLAMPDGAGALVLLKAGARESRDKLVQGENILRASADFDMTGRFQEYLVQGQQPGTDKAWGLEACAVSANCRDEAITRYRPKLIRAEKSVDTASARQRAAWEKSVRAARSVTLKATVQGFRQRLAAGQAAGVAGEQGQLWQVNSLTEVDIPYLRISQRLLVSKVTFLRDPQSGSVTELELRDPAAFQPEPKKAAGSGGKSGASGGGNLKIAQEQDIQTRMATDAAKAGKSIG